LYPFLQNTSKKENQYDFFLSKVVDPKEENPNARPGVELYFRSQKSLDNVMPILSEFTSRGVDGFTLALDPRVDSESGSYIGIRMQYVPEISMRWDEDLRNVMSTPAGLQSLMEQKSAELEDIVARIANIEDIAYSSVVEYDTLVVGKENYDDYISPKATRKNIETGKSVWFGQPVRDHVEAAVERYTGKRPPAYAGEMGDAGKRGGARYSLRSEQLAIRPSTESDGISLGERQPDAISVDAFHYGKNKNRHSQRLSLRHRSQKALNTIAFALRMIRASRTAFISTSRALMER